MSLDGTDPAGHHAQHAGGRDPPPAWSGDQPGQWGQVRRDLLLWSADTDLVASKRGVRFFRQLSGRARLLADGLEDRRLMASDGLQYIIDHFDGIYKDTLEVEKELEGEKALFQGQKQSDENFVSYVHRRLVEYARYEAVLGEPLPTALKGKLLVRQAKLTASQAQQVTTWLDGHRDMASIQAALCRLDSDRDLLGVTIGGSKSYFEGEDLATPAAYYEDEAVDPDERDDLAEFYLDAHLDVGYDSSDEEQIWIYATDLEAEHEEADINSQFSTFQSVLRAKQQAKKARGWFTPTRWAEEHGEQKGKGLRVPPKGKGGFRGKKGSKGFGKGKGTGKASSSMASRPYDQLRQERDVRRAQSGMVRVPTTQLTSRIRCWRCGNLGHTSRNCGKGDSKGSRDGTSANTTNTNPNPRPSYFVLPFDNDAHTGFNYAQFDGGGSSYFQMASNLGVVDTGAVNAVVGQERLRGQILPLLEKQGLQTVSLPFPPSLGGIGGQTQTKDGIMLPVMIGECPGLVSTIVVAGDVPLLLPSPLLESLEAEICYPQQQIHWTREQTKSDLVRLPSGHVAVAVNDGSWTRFWEQVPGAEKFKRTPKPQRHVMFTDEEEIVAESECMQYEQAWMPQNLSWRSTSSCASLPLAQ
eukprot:1857259-Amphidinium_carterae.1